MENDWSANAYLKNLKSELSKRDVRIAKRSALLGNLDFDVYHLHSEPTSWVSESLLLSTMKLTRLFAILLYCRILGKKVVSTVHDIRPYERGSDRVFNRIFFNATRGCILRSIDAFVLHSQSLRKSLPPNILAQKTTVVCPHPIYEMPGSLLGFEGARTKLGYPLDKKILLIFGDFRSHKNPSEFLKSLVLIIDNNPAYEALSVVIAGKGAEASTKSVPRHEKIEIIDGYIPELELNTLIEASSWIVLPYSSVSGSGLVHLAAAFKKPLLLSRLEYFEEICGNEGVLYFSLNDVSDLRTTLSSAIALSDADLATFGARLNKHLGGYHWSDLAAASATLYSELLQRSVDQANRSP